MTRKMAAKKAKKAGGPKAPAKAPEAKRRTVVKKRKSKSEEKIFYKIGEVCSMTDTEPYVLRYWESEFPNLAPSKNRSGQRIYTREDVDMVLRIKELLYQDGYTIAGARRKLEEPPARETRPKAPPRAGESSDLEQMKGRVRRLRSGLQEILEMLS